jgi:hypothetical protein
VIQNRYPTSAVAFWDKPPFTVERDKTSSYQTLPKRVHHWLSRFNVCVSESLRRTLNLEPLSSHSIHSILYDSPVFESSNKHTTRISSAFNVVTHQTVSLNVFKRPLFSCLTESLRRTLNLEPLAGGQQIHGVSAGGVNTAPRVGLNF